MKWKRLLAGFGLCTALTLSSSLVALAGDRITNGDFSYPGNLAWQDGPAAGISGGEAKWTYIDPSGQQGAVYRQTIPGFNSNTFAWKSDHPALPYGSVNFPAGIIEFQRAGNQQYAEMVASVGGYAIYQDIQAEGGAILYWSIKHAPRGSTYTGGDEIKVQIGPPGQVKTQQATRTTNNGSGDRVGETMTTIHTSKPNNTTFAPWETYEGRYLVPGTGQQTIRFTFASGAAGSTGASGNLLDDVVFTPAFAVHFDTNGGSDMGYRPENDNYKGYRMDGAKAVLNTITTKIPTREGYTFLGWSETKEKPATNKATGDLLKPVTSVVVKDRAKTVYALWGKNPTVTFVDRDTTVSKKTTTYGGGVAKPTAPTRTGYTFDGWTFGDFSKVYEDGTATALWAPNTYTLTYEKNTPSNALVGDKDVTLSPPSQTAKYDSPWGTLGTASKPGYLFQGWKTKASGGSSMTPETICKGDATVYAQWVPSTCTLTYDGNNPSNTTDDVVLSKPSQTITYDTPWGTLGKATKKGYLFQGWYTSATGGTVISAQTIGKGDLTVYAHWRPIGYTIEFRGNKEHAGDNPVVTGSMAPMHLTYNQMGRLPRNGYQKTTMVPAEDADGTTLVKASVFQGYSANPEAVEPTYAEQASVMNLTAKEGDVIVLYAIWDDAPMFRFERYPDRYFTLDEAQQGAITPDELLQTVVAYDRETNPLVKRPNGGSGPGITVVDYGVEDFTKLTDDSTVTVRYKAEDGAGNVAFITINVYVSRNGHIPDRVVEYFRSINQHYLEQAANHGGLADNSKWQETVDKERFDTLMGAFSDTKQYDVTLDKETMSKIRDYVRDNGYGNSNDSTALTRLYEELQR